MFEGLRGTSRLVRRRSFHGSLHLESKDQFKHIDDDSDGLQQRQVSDVERVNIRYNRACIVVYFSLHVHSFTRSSVILFSFNAVFIFISVQLLFVRRHGINSQAKLLTEYSS